MGQGVERGEVGTTGKLRSRGEDAGVLLDLFILTMGVDCALHARIGNSAANATRQGTIQRIAIELA
eukprot:8438581-Pyramimonas_sp.AAC.1